MTQLETNYDIYWGEDVILESSQLMLDDNDIKKIWSDSTVRMIMELMQSPDGQIQQEAFLLGRFLVTHHQAGQVTSSVFIKNGILDIVLGGLENESEVIKDASLAMLSQICYHSENITNTIISCKLYHSIFHCLEYFISIDEYYAWPELTHGLYLLQNILSFNKFEGNDTSKVCALRNLAIKMLKHIGDDALQYIADDQFEEDDPMVQEEMWNLFDLLGNCNGAATWGSHIGDIYFRKTIVLAAFDNVLKLGAQPVNEVWCAIRKMMKNTMGFLDINDINDIFQDITMVFDMKDSHNIDIKTDIICGLQEFADTWKEFIDLTKLQWLRLLKNILQKDTPTYIISNDQVDVKVKHRYIFHICDLLKTLIAAQVPMPETYIEWFWKLLQQDGDNFYALMSTNMLLLSIIISDSEITIAMLRSKKYDLFNALCTFGYEADQSATEKLLSLMLFE